MSATESGVWGLLPENCKKNGALLNVSSETSIKKNSSGTFQWESSLDDGIFTNRASTLWKGVVRNFLEGGTPLNLLLIIFEQLAGPTEMFELERR